MDGINANFPQAAGPPLLGGIAGMSLLLAVAYREEVKSSGDLSITTAVAMLLTLILGSLAAPLQLLVLSVVILPNLPDVGFGPYGALNPYRLWWVVVLIAGLSLAGHLAMRLTGSERGGLPTTSTVIALGLATLANMATKASISWTTGGSAVGWKVLRGYGAGMALGAITVVASISV